MKINVDGRIANLVCAFKHVPFRILTPVLPEPQSVQLTRAFGLVPGPTLISLNMPTVWIARGTKFELGWRWAQSMPSFSKPKLRAAGFAFLSGEFSQGLRASKARRICAEQRAPQGS